MTENPIIATVYKFKEREYLFKLKVMNCNVLEIIVKDKTTGEEWQNTYDASYIENLTRKTGNYKQFHIFIEMLKSGLLKTGESITLDLLTRDDLDYLRCHSNSTFNRRSSRSDYGFMNSDRRYLILTYSVEFDRIHYPLPLEYCGFPDPVVLQGIIRRLENEIYQLKRQVYVENSQNNTPLEKQNKLLESRVEALTEENAQLSSEILHLNKSLKKRTHSRKQNEILQNSIKRLEKQVMEERNNFKKTIWRLKEEKSQLLNQIDELRNTEKCLRLRLKNIGSRKISPQPSAHIVKSVKRMEPDGISPDQRTDLKTNLKRSTLMCRPISCWSNTSHIRKPESVVTIYNPRPNYRSSSGSSLDKHNKHLSRKRSLSPANNSKGVNIIKSKPRIRSINSSTEHQKGCTTKLRPRNTSSTSSDFEEYNFENKRTGKNMRRSNSQQSSTSSLGHSRTSRKSNLKPKRKSVTVNTNEIRNDHINQCNQDIKINMSDLERRIHSLQQLLHDGLTLK